MKFSFDFVTILLIILIIIVLIFLLSDYKIFRNFILNNRERERLFTDEQMKNYINKLDIDKEILKKYVEDFKDGKNLKNTEEYLEKNQEENLEEDEF